MIPLTREFLVSRGSCCGNICKNCPYHPKNIKGSSTVVELPIYKTKNNN
jgi:hypothetical protein